MRPRLLPAVSALARPAGAGLVAAGVLLVASGLAGPAPAAHARSALPKPRPRAGPEIVHDLPRWSVHVDGRLVMVAFEGMALGVRDRTAAETAAIGSSAPAGLRVWSFVRRLDTGRWEGDDQAALNAQAVALGPELNVLATGVPQPLPTVSDREQPSRATGRANW